MEGPRTSLWSRLVVFYSTNLPEKLNPEVRALLDAEYAENHGFKFIWLGWLWDVGNYSSSHEQLLYLYSQVELLCLLSSASML